MEEGLDEVNRVSLPKRDSPDNENLRRAFKEIPKTEPKKVAKEKPKLSEFEV